MEQQQEIVIPKAPFPAPPPFWRHFTTSNLERFKVLQSNDSSSQQLLPLELTYLRPPPPPSSTAKSYTTFSQLQPLDTTPTLPPSNQLLFNPNKPINHAQLLAQLTNSLLLNFGELIGVLSADPTQHADKMEDIRQLTVNVHAVLNMYRPHQARESVKEMLEGILEEGQREIEECEGIKAKVEDFVKGLQTQKEGPPETAEENDYGTTVANKEKGEGRGEEKMEEVRRLWKMIHEIGDE